MSIIVVVLIVLVIIFVLVVGFTISSFKVYKGTLNKKELKINELLKQVQHLRNQMNNVNLRQGYRLDMADDECIFQFIELGDSSLHVLKNRKGVGRIKDISTTGMKIGCNYDLPLNKDITITTEFKLVSEWFSLQALLTRKEKHIDSPDVIYGIQFVEMSENDQKRLLLCVNNLALERRNKLA